MIDDLSTSHSITGNKFSNFEMVAGKIATGLKKILTITNFKKEVFLEEQRAHVINITLRGDDVQGFDTRWKEVLLFLKERDSEGRCTEKYVQNELRDSEPLKTTYALYNHDSITKKRQ